MIKKMIGGGRMKLKILVVTATLLLAAIGLYDLIANGGKLFFDYGRCFFPQ
jgi:hypothetical protein